MVEENTTSRDVRFQVQRGPGIFGMIGVMWQVSHYDKGLWSITNVCFAKLV